MPRKVAVILNPVAGKGTPVLHTINEVFQSFDVEWNYYITKKSGDARAFAGRAREDGVDCVAVFGGDGTVSEVANGLKGGSIPLGILPGGTANILSIELGIPRNLAKACALVCSPRPNVRTIDAVDTGSSIFLLRLSGGFEAELVKAADRKWKSRLGVLAYALSGFQAMIKTKATRYRIQIDGRTVEEEGLSFVIANSANLGLPGVGLSPRITVDDGLLDLIIIRHRDIQLLFRDEKNKINPDDQELFGHWQGKDLVLEADHPPSMQCDGEVWTEFPVHARIRPGSVPVIAPPSVRSVP